MDYFIAIIFFILIFIILSQSYNLVLGYTGMVHVGHVAFMAIGAYTSALLTLNGLPFWFGAVSGIAASALAGLILGLPTVRFKEDYVVAGTLAMGEIIRIFILNERWLTGGSTGLPKIMRPEFLNLPFVFLITLATLLLIWRLVHSPFGKVLESIREDEIAAKALGKNTSLIKLQILVIGAAFAGLSGVLLAHTIQFIDPDSFNLNQMIFVFLIVVFGGSGNFWGPVVGTVILYTLFELMRFIPFTPHVLGPMRWIVYSLILIFTIIYKPGGIMGKRILKKKL